MAGFGEKLRHEREMRNVPIDRIATSTGIDRGYLEALEENDLQALPGRSFGKLYIRAYAKVLGFDPQPLIHAYDREQEKRRNPNDATSSRRERPRPVGAVITGWREDRIAERNRARRPAAAVDRSVADTEEPDPGRGGAGSSSLSAPGDDGSLAAPHLPQPSAASIERPAGAAGTVRGDVPEETNGLETDELMVEGRRGETSVAYGEAPRHDGRASMEEAPRSVSPEAAGASGAGTGAPIGEDGLGQVPVLFLSDDADASMEEAPRSVSPEPAGVSGVGTGAPIGEGGLGQVPVLFLSDDADASRENAPRRESAVPAWALDAGRRPPAYLEDADRGGHDALFVKVDGAESEEPGPSRLRHRPRPQTVKASLEMLAEAARAGRSAVSTEANAERPPSMAGEVLDGLESQDSFLWHTDTAFPTVVAGDQESVFETEEKPAVGAANRARRALNDQRRSSTTLRVVPAALGVFAAMAAAYFAVVLFRTGTEKGETSHPARMSVSGSPSGSVPESLQSEGVPETDRAQDSMPSESSGKPRARLHEVEVGQSTLARTPASTQRTSRHSKLEPVRRGGLAAGSQPFPRRSPGENDESGSSHDRRTDPRTQEGARPVGADANHDGRGGGGVDPSISAAALPALAVAESGVGLRVTGHELQERNDRFTDGTAVWFWTHVVGGKRGDAIRHVWLREGRIVQSIKLRVGAPDWRTQTSKTLRGPGHWAVEARDTQGRVLASAVFTCTPMSR